MPQENLTHNTTKPNNKYDKDSIKQQHNFYKVNRDKDGAFKSITIKKVKIVDKLMEYNFFRFPVEKDVYRYVQINDNLVREVDKEEITDRFINYVELLADYEHEFTHESRNGGELYTITVTAKTIRETLFEKLSEYFSKTLFNRLVSPKPIEIKKHEKNQMFFYYQNGYVSVTKDKTELLNYDTLDLNIWENQRLNRDFKVNETIGVFEKFIYRVCGYKGTNFKDIEINVIERYNAIKSIIGYNLHGFFDGKLFASVITDSRISDGYEPNGRTGKTLWAKALGKMLNYDGNARVYTEINGKDFNPREKHRYSDAGMETQLINLNDLGRNTSIENFFNDITEGVTVDKKNEKPFKIKTKIIISTNRTIKIEGESGIDRVKQFEFSDWYDSNRSPEKEFGCWFFSKEWNSQEWNKFDTFMLSCCMYYLSHGIKQPKSINLHKRILIDHTCHEFVDFMDEFFKTGFIILNDEAREKLFEDKLQLEYGEKLNKKLLYEAFTEQYKSYFSKLPTQRTFTNWLRVYTKNTKELETITKTNGLEGRTNGMDYIIFKKIEHEQKAPAAG